MLTVVIDHVFDVFHDLGVATVGFEGHVGHGAFGFEDAGRLRVQHEGDCEEAFDPFLLCVRGGVVDNEERCVISEDWKIPRSYELAS